MVKARIFCVPVAKLNKLHSKELLVNMMHDRANSVQEVIIAVLFQKPKSIRKRG